MTKAAEKIMEKKVKSAAKADDGQVNLLSLPVPYCGVPSEYRIIPPGTYRANDPLLFGLGEYLVNTRHARVIGRTDPYPQDEEDDDEDMETGDEGEKTPSPDDKKPDEGAKA